MFIGLGLGLSSHVGAGAGAFDPTQLTNLIAYYDPLDLTSLDQSRTGGTPAAVGSPVGIMLDKRYMGGQTAAAFIAGQSELVTNGDFASNINGWSTNGATAVWSSDKMEVTNSAANGSAYQAISTVVGVTYRVDFAITGSGNRRFTKSDSTTQFGTNFVTFANTNNGPVYFVATATTTYLHFGISSGATGLVMQTDNVSCKAVPGNHAIAGANAGAPTGADSKRPTLASGPYLDYDVDDVMAVNFATSQGSTCSVYYRTQAGANVWSDNQTIGSGWYNLSTTDWRRALITSSTPTAAEKLQIEAWGAGS